MTSYKYLPQSKELYSYMGPRNKYAVKISDVPHQVLVIYDSVYCSGSLIFSRIVLTVASCFRKRSTKVTVKVGANTITSMGQVIPVLEKKFHEYYNHEVPLNNDIALLFLERNVNFGPNTKKVVIVEPEVAIRVGTSLDVTGWAGNNLSSMKNIHRILVSEMKVTSDEVCHQKYGDLKTESKYCAKYQPEYRLSDNGGSALYKDNGIDVLVGILSYGATSNEEAECIALFTNISYFHRWIIFNSQKLLNKHCIDEPLSDYASYESNGTSETYELEVERHLEPEHRQYI
ncbi:trypsin-5-like [Amyelois transitella]|uniref:trypsin-5-like n=1 Tax=Amyelois transitella TaxID=680683 RepID=UPI00299002C3|nr:trypsin-5-like [Amyelois transitella]